jgi:uncharacterized repeat protein (TIGR01451 family)
MQRLILVLLSLFLLTLTSPWLAVAQEEGSIELKSIAEVEVEDFNAEGQKVLMRIPAAKVVPGDEVIYTNTYTNVGSEAAANVVITNPVPEHMQYLSASALGPDMVITFSIDGGQTYDAPDRLMIVEADGSKRQAKPSEYTHIRWIRQKPLEPGENGQVSFKARLK